MNIRKWLLEQPGEPEFDPTHLAGALIVNFAAAGGLYWLLWTLLVFEGGIFIKLSAAAELLLTSKTLKDFGYEGGPYAMGVFEGWAGNFAALLLAVTIVIALYRTYREAARRRAAGK